MSDTNLTIDVAIDTKQAVNDLKNLKTELKDANKEFSNSSKAIDGYADTHEALNKQLQSAIKRQDAYEKAISSTKNVIKGYTQQLEKEEKSLQDIKNKVGEGSEEYIKQEKKVESCKKEIQKYTRELQNLESDSEVATRQVKELSNKIDKLGDEVQETSNEFKSMSDNVKKINFTNVANTLTNLGNSFRDVGGDIVNFFKDGLEKASELSAEMDTVNFMFEQLPANLQKAVNEFSSQSFNFGFTEKQGQEMATELATFFNNAGIADRIDMTEVWERVFDLSAMYDMDVSDVVDHLKGILIGSFQNSDALGFNMTQGLIEEINGIEKFNELSFDEQQYQSLIYFLEQTEIASGRSSEEAETFNSKLHQMEDNVKTLTTLGFQPLMDLLTPFLDKFNSATDSIKTFIENNEGLVGVFSVVAIAIGGILTVLGFLLPIIANIVLICTNWSTIMTGVGAVLGFLTNPITLIIGAVVALGTALVLAYNNCETFRNIVNNAFNAVKDVVLQLWEVIQPYLIQAGDMLVQAWQVASDFLSSCFNTIKEVFMNTWGVIRDYFNSDETQAKITYAWQVISNFLSDIWNGIVTIFTDVFGAIKAWFENDTTQETLINAWTNIQNFLMGVWNLIKDVVVTVFGGIFTFLNDHGTSIISIFESCWGFLSAWLGGIWEEIKEDAMIIFGLLQAFWNTWGDEISTAFSTVFEGLCTIVSGAWDNIKFLFEGALDILGGIIDALASLLKGDFEQMWEDIKGLCNSFVDFIKGLVSRILAPFEGIGQKIKNAFGDMFGWITGEKSVSLNVDLPSGANELSTMTDYTQSALPYALNSLDTNSIATLEIPQLYTGYLSGDSYSSSRLYTNYYSTNNSKGSTEEIVEQLKE
ncbi:hypothetical protein GMC37_13760, partial [Turicibacter sanguinis]|nr:hypothetical protein [Turicibacter sanguinis]